MDVVFLFMSQSSASPNSTPNDWKADSPCGDYYNDHFAGEGYFKQLANLRQRGVIKNLSVFYESNKAPGYANWIKEADCQVIPEIRFVDKYIKKDTIIYVRGGFKHWHDFLLKYKGNNWLMLYAANTGRQRWTWWDIVLNDLKIVNYVDSKQRYWHHFIKPIDETMFYPDYNVFDPIYDICIGASHIHDRKGQWRTVKVMQAYKDIYNVNLKAIMPGSFRRSTETLKMIPELEKLNIEMPGMLPRHQLNKIFNTSKYFIHLGAHGQNDRGPLEALSCGTPVILGSPEYHAELMHNDNSITFIPKDINDFEGTAKYLHILLQKWQSCFKEEVVKKYKQKLSFEKSCDRMKSLLTMMYVLKKPTLDNKERIRAAFDVIDSNDQWYLDIN